MRRAVRRIHHIQKRARQFKFFNAVTQRVRHFPCKQPRRVRRGRGKRRRKRKFVRQRLPQQRQRGMQIHRRRMRRGGQRNPFLPQHRFGRYGIIRQRFGVHDNFFFRRFNSQRKNVRTRAYIHRGQVYYKQLCTPIQVAISQMIFQSQPDLI